MIEIKEENTSNTSNTSNPTNSENSNESGKRVKRRNKKQMYSVEREKMIEEMNEILGITEENDNTLYLYELEKNDKIREYLKNNMSRIRKYHKTGTWGFFSNDELKGKGNYTTLLRTLYVDNDYEILSKLKINNFDNIKKQYTLLIFLKKTKKKCDK